MKYVILLIGFFGSIAFAEPDLAVTQKGYDVIEIDLYALYADVSNGSSPADGGAVRTIRNVLSRITNFGQLPIFAGYRNANSDVNDERYIAPICRYLGYDRVESYAVGWMAGDRSPTVTVFTEGREPYAYDLNIQSNRNVNLVRRLACARYGK